MSSPSEILQITRRFFLAINTLKSERQITGLKDFCEIHGLNVTRYYELKNLTEGKPSRYKTLEVDALFALANDYNFSLQWLFFGKGEQRKSAKENINCVPTQMAISKISYR